MQNQKYVQTIEHLKEQLEKQKSFGDSQALKSLQSADVGRHKDKTI